MVYDVFYSAALGGWVARVYSEQYGGESDGREWYTELGTWPTEEEAISQAEAYLDEWENLENDD